MRLRHLMTAALGVTVLSCQGPAAVLAREAPSDPGVVDSLALPDGAGPRAAPD